MSYQAHVTSTYYATLYHKLCQTMYWTHWSIISHQVWPWLDNEGFCKPLIRSHVYISYTPYGHFTFTLHVDNLTFTSGGGVTGNKAGKRVTTVGDMCFCFEWSFFKAASAHFQSCFATKTSIWGGCGSRVEPASCHQKAAGSIPPVCMLKCPWARYWTLNSSWCAGQRFVSQPPPSVYVWIVESRLGPKRLLNALNVNVFEAGWYKHYQ